MNKTVVYFDLSPESYTNTLIDKGISYQVNPESFDATLDQILGQPADTLADVRQQLQNLGYVLNADQILADEIERQLKTLIKS